MNGFRFRLERVLDWRRTQLGLAEDAFRREGAALAGIDRARAALEAAAREAETRVREAREVSGRDLAALGEFRMGVAVRMADLAAQRQQRVRALEARQTAMLEARRRCRLLERLRERRWEEWRGARDREIEELSAEAFLAQWNAGM